MRQNLSSWFQTERDSNHSLQGWGSWGHVAYQITGNETYVNINANVLPLHTPLTPGVRSKSQNSCIFYLKVVMLHIKLKRMKHRTNFKHEF